jgi:aldehyde:ferredoxin oxidoreductase
VAIPRQEFEDAMTELYLAKGWDPDTSRPTRERLCELGIEWAADLM